MAIEDILASLDVQADAEIDRILARARDEAGEITGAATTRAEAAAETYVAGAVNEAKVEAERELHAESSAYRRSVADVRREIFDEVFVLAADRIKDVRDSEKYPEILSRLVEDATSDMGKDYILHVDPRDKDLVAEVCKGIACATDITTVGGVVVTDPDERIYRSSTFEDRLQRIKEEHIELVSEVLNP